MTQVGVKWLTQLARYLTVITISICVAESQSRKLQQQNATSPSGVFGAACAYELASVCSASAGSLSLAATASLLASSACIQDNTKYFTVTWLRFPAWFNGLGWIGLQELQEDPATAGIAEGAVFDRPDGLPALATFSSAGSFKDYMVMNEDRYSIVSADISGVPLSNAWMRAKTGTFQQLAPGYVASLAENVCVNDTEPRGLLHPRTYLAMYYRAEALAALAAGGYVPSAAPPDDWEQLIALLEAHRLANSSRSSSSSGGSSGGLPKYGLCITTHPDCGRLGDVWAALAASILQTQGTEQGYLYDLAEPPPAATPMANSTGWVHATGLLRRMLAYNAPEPGVREHRECTDISSHFLSGDCMITFEWDVSVLRLRVAALQPPAAQLLVAPLPGSRTVMDRRAGSSTSGQLVPCDWELCGVSANHDLLYLPGPTHPGGGGSAGADGASASTATAALTVASGGSGTDQQVLCDPAEAKAFEAAEAKAVRAGPGQGLAADAAVSWALLNRAPYSVMVQHFVRYQASTVGDTTSPARRFEALGEAVDTLVARVAILRGGVMAAARRRVGFPPANESTGITGNPHSYMRTRWWELLRRPFDVQPYLSLGLGNDTMQSYMAVLLHGTHSPNAAGDVTSPILVNFAKWALSQAAYVLEPPAGELAVANATAEVMRIVDMMEQAFGADLLRSTYEDAVDAPVWTPPVATAHGSAGGQGGEFIGHGALAGLLVGLITAVLLSVLTLVFVALRLRRRNRDLLGRVRAPRAGVDTTLLISDIQNSTRLWEELSVTTMDAALKMHHATFRKLMPAHDGYESATEGDSFIIAFPSPASALAFATACQLALLHQDWPQELLQHEDGAVVAVEARGGDALELLTGASMAATMALAQGNETPKQSENGLLAADSGILPPLAGQLAWGRSQGPRWMLRSLDLPPNIEREPLPLPASVLSTTTRSRRNLGLNEPAAEVSSAQAAPSLALMQLDPTAAAAEAEWAPVAAARSARARWSLSNTPLAEAVNTAARASSCNTGDGGAAGASGLSASGGDAAIDPALVVARASSRQITVLQASAAMDVGTPRIGADSMSGLPTGSTTTIMVRATFAGTGLSVSQPGVTPLYGQPTVVDDVPGPGSQPGGQSYAGAGMLAQSMPAASRPHSLKGTGFAGGGGFTGYPAAPNSFGAAAGDNAPSLQLQPLQRLRRVLASPSRPASAAQMQPPPAPRPPSPWPGGGSGHTGPGATAGEQSCRLEADSTPSTSTTWGQALAAAFPVASGTAMAAAASRRGKRRLSSAAQLAMGFLSGGGAGTGTLGSNVVAYRGLRVRMGIHTSLAPSACILTFNRVNSTYHYTGTLAETAKLVSDAANGGLVVLSAQAFTRLRNTGNSAAAAKADAVVIYAGHFVLKDKAQGYAAAANGQSPTGAASETNGAGKGNFERMTEGQVGLVLDGSHVQFMHMAKSTVQDAGPAPASRGGKKLVAARPSLPPDTAGTVTTGATGPGDVPLFVAVPASLLCRLAHTPPLRTLRQVQLGSLAAPTGSVTIAFMKVVGASTLLTDLPGPARRALDQFQRLACGLLLLPPQNSTSATGPTAARAAEAAAAAAIEPVAVDNATLACSGASEEVIGGSGGYLVEGGDGLVLAAFGSPLAAVEWALDTVEALRELVWEEELLAHEMCEEVLTAGPAPVSAAAAAPAKPRAISGGVRSITDALSPLPSSLAHAPDCSTAAGQQDQPQAAEGQPRWRSLERGLRVKVGLDVGPVTYSLTESSGRLSYRGRVMNRAARIAGTASPGQVLCSGAVWAACEAGMAAVPLPGSSQQLVGVSLGKVALKGITSPVEIFQCQREGC